MRKLFITLTMLAAIVSGQQPHGGYPTIRGAVAPGEIAVWRSRTEVGSGGAGLTWSNGTMVVTNLSVTGTAILPSPLYFGDIYTGNLYASNSIVLKGSTISNITQTVTTNATDIPSGAAVTDAFAGVVAGKAEALRVNESTVSREVVYSVPPARTNIGVIVTFITDDGQVEDATIMAPMFTNRAVPLVIATSIKGTNATPPLTHWELTNLVNYVDNYGFEVAWHSINHTNLTLCDDAELDYQLRYPKEWAAENGITIKNAVYTYGASNERTRTATRKYYRCGIQVNGKLYGNTLPLDQYNVGRIQVEGNTLDYLKGTVTNALAQGNSWLVYMVHPWQTNFSTEVMSNFLDYVVISNSLPVMTIDSALDVLGNVIDIGDSSGPTEGTVPDVTSKRFSVGADGTVKMGAGFPVVWLGSGVKSAYYATNYVTNWPDKAVSILAFTSAAGATMGYTNGAGMLKTDRTAGMTLDLENYLKGYVYQELWIYNSSTVYRRYWNSSSTWTEWVQMSSAGQRLTIFSGTSGAFATNTINDFTPRVLSIHRMIQSTATNSGWFGAGTLYTDRRRENTGNPSAVGDRQKYEMESSITSYERYWTSGNEWSAWVTNHPPVE